MKKGLKILTLLAASTMLIGCGNKGGGGKDPDGGGSSVVTTKFSFSGIVVSSSGTPISGAKIKFGEEDYKTNSEGRFEIEEVDPKAGPTTISIKALGFLDQTFDLLSFRKDKETEVAAELEMTLMHSMVGGLIAKPWEQYENFSFFATRNSTSLLLKAVSPNGVFTREGRYSKVEFYISVNEVDKVRDSNVTQVIVYSNGAAEVNNMGTRVIDSRKAKITMTKPNDHDQIEVELPFSLLGTESDKIIGLSFGLWSETDADWAPFQMVGLASPSNVEIPTTYARFDKNNSVFACKANCYPEDLPAPDYDKAALIEGKPFHTADPGLTNSMNADDVYIGVDKSDTAFNFHIVGFEDFADDEYLKFIFHTSATNHGAWAIDETDLTVLVNKTTTAKKTGMTDFWEFIRFGDEDVEANNAPSYTYDEKGYWNLEWSIDFDEIPNYDPNEPVTLFCMEFGNGVIYDGRNYLDGMLINGERAGDPAMQSSYWEIQERVIDVDVDTLTQGYNIRFSHEGDNIYAKVNKEEDGVRLKFISFSRALGSASFIRFVVHSASTATSGIWKLDPTDVSVCMYADGKAYSEVGLTDFWANEKTAVPFCPNKSEMLNSFEYENKGQYWEGSMLVEYSEIGAGIDKNSPLSGMLWEFVGGTIMNSCWVNKLKVPDTAEQKNYFDID